MSRRCLCTGFTAGPSGGERSTVKRTHSTSQQVVSSIVTRESSPASLYLHGTPLSTRERRLSRADDDNEQDLSVWYKGCFIVCLAKERHDSSTTPGRALNNAMSVSKGQTSFCQLLFSEFLWDSQPDSSGAKRSIVNIFENFREKSVKRVSAVAIYVGTAVWINVSYSLTVTLWMWWRDSVTVIVNFKKFIRSDWNDFIRTNTADVTFSVEQRRIY